MPWKKRHYPTVTPKQAALLFSAAVLTGILACLIGSGSDRFYKGVVDRFTGYIPFMSAVPAEKR
jgi:hypothetical protein